MNNKIYTFALAIVTVSISTAQTLPVSATGASRVYQTVTTSVNELSLDRVLKVYPNPASSFLEVKLDSDYEFNGAELSIQDIQGRVVYSEKNVKFKGNTLKIDTKQLSSGVYTLYLKSDKNVTAYKKFAIDNK